MYPYAVIIALFMLSGIAVAQEAQLRAGMLAHSAEDFARARQLWEPLAEAGHAEAQLFLAHSHARGQGAPQDYVQAARWYQAAAAQGLPEAQYQLGLLYETGLGMPKDLTQAHYWYQQVTAQGVCPGTLNPAGRLE